MPDRQIASLNKNGREAIRISISEFRGARYVDVRTYATNAESALVPTPKGVSLRPTMLRAAIDALTEAERTLIQHGAIKPGGAS